MIKHYAEIRKETSTLTEFNTKIMSFSKIADTEGYLDLLVGAEVKTARMFEKSTHIFICDYVDVDFDNVSLYQVHFPDLNETFEILHVDDPLHSYQRLEIELKKIKIKEG